jgi:hypothetical protein
MTILLMALNLATMSVRLTNSDQRDEHIPCSSREFHDNNFSSATFLPQSNCWLSARRSSLLLFSVANSFSAVRRSGANRKE